MHLSVIKYINISTCCLRITTLGYGPSGTSSCRECCKLVEKGACVGEDKNETNANSVYGDKPKIPGLYPGAEEKSPDDRNLAPLSSPWTKTLQYGDTSFISMNTDNPDWAPGECINLHKYEGNFRVKISGPTMQVNYALQLSNC